MKVSGELLGKLIREVVRQELKSVLPQMLSELYIKKIVEDKRKSNKSSLTLSEIMQGDEKNEDQSIPQVLSNDDEDIYGENPIVKNQKRTKKITNEMVEKLRSKNNPLSFVYDDKLASADVSEKNEIVISSQESVGRLDESFVERMKAYSDRTLKAKDNQQQKDYDEKMKELERKRKLLDAKEI